MLLNWLEEWYRSSCDGDWEELYGITISSLDNPGWLVEIDLFETPLENKTLLPIYIVNTDDDWVCCRTENCRFYGSGDPTKLAYIIEIFKKWTEECIN